ncbi:MAG: transposase [Anaerolineales bacterium]|nr:transposase [Anaerolineales bacterium]
MKAMCKFFGVSRAAYYAWEGKLGETDPDQERMDKIQAAYEASHKSYGYRRVTIDLQRKLGISINHKAVLRLMRKLGIRSQPESQKCTKVGRNRHVPPLSQCTQSGLCSAKPNQSGLRMSPTSALQGWAYLSTIKDLYDGFIVACL